MKLIKLNKQLTRTRFCGIIYCRETTPASALRAYLTFALSFSTSHLHFGAGGMIFIFTLALWRSAHF
jgi:hypothetical protein